MRRALTKKVIISLLFSILIITLLQVTSLAQSEKLQMIKKSENEYLIYVSNLLDSEFQFAFANESEISDKSTLEFEESALDKLENGNHIAYITSTLYTKYFEGEKDVFLWVKQGEEYKLEAEKIQLTNALTEEDVQAINNATKTIEVKVGDKQLPVETIDGVKVTRKIGILNISKQDGNYSYKMIKATEGTDASKLIELANEVNNINSDSNNTTMFEKLSTYNEFKTLYNKIKPAIDDSKWTPVEEYIIEQPENSKDGEQYLVWIKKDVQNEADATTIQTSSIIDVQIMTCRDEYIPEYEKQETVIKETTKLPITGDSIVLFIIAGTILTLIIVVALLKTKNKNNEK